ncbi:MAG: phosphorylcholine transferase LicD [Clostridia bacterium]
MNQIQEKLYKLLIEVDTICQKHGIVYYLAAGGALGAIRNGGFLPWDDDIDLYITRDNWEKLKIVMKEELPDNREFVCAEYTELYCNPIGRYVDKETTLMMKSQLLCGKCCGLLVEFFIMDPMPLDEEGKWRHRTYMKAYTEILSPYFVLNREIFAHNIDFDYKLYNKYYWLSKLVGRKKVLHMLMDKFARSSEENCQEFCMRWGQRTVIFPKAMFGKAKMVKFEDREFPLVEYPEKTFRVGYGDDWMYVPEGENQISHDLSNDLEEPFETYVNLYMPFLNEKKLLKAFKKRKRIAIKGLSKKESYERKFAGVCAKLYAENILRSEVDLQKLRICLENENFDTLNQELNQFYQAQADVRLKANDILVPLSDEYIYIAVMNHTLQGYYYKAAKIMMYREKLAETLSQELIQAKQLIAFCRELSIAIYDEKSVGMVKSILSQNPAYEGVLDFQKAELWVLYKTASNKNDFEELIQKSQVLLKTHENDGEILRFEGYGLYRQGYLKEAEDKYKMAIKYTRNGFVWKEAKELLGIDAYQIADFSQEAAEQDEEEE